MSDVIYTNDEIIERLHPVFKNYGVRRAILFGSYSNGTADSNSDVDLVVDSGLKGLNFVGFIEDISEALDKEVDVFDVTHIIKDSKVDQEILRTGREIYAK
ncbi:MAG: nucleotidyltransferase domain-containing protein [Eubacteriales bacterium]|nr:nucleotidyltransferase domain-containing protein [Eubacteriales bacterium]